MVGIVTVNCRHSHTSPAIRILRNIALDLGITGAWCQEFTLSDPVWKMAAAIHQRKPQLLGMSLSLWNRDAMIALAHRLRAIDPNLTLVAGGPEVSFMETPPEPFDFLVRGDGEHPWTILLEALVLKTNIIPKSVLGVYSEPTNHTPVWPYREMDLPTMHGRLAYIETTRGCPFRCAFCLSSRDRQLRTWHDPFAPHFRQRLIELHDAGVTTFKFLDRSFNADPQRAEAIIKQLQTIEGACFHIEIAPDCLTDSLIATLNNTPVGMFQLEIGIQSVHPHVLKLIQRSSDFAHTSQAIHVLVQGKRVHIHADLIWGLPSETLADIATGFDQVYSLGVHELQLGFLKFLPGAPIQNLRREYEFAANAAPPYEIYANSTLSGETVLALQEFAQTFDLFANSKRFTRSIRTAIHHTGLAPFAFFDGLRQQANEQNLLLTHPGLDRLYEFMSSLFADIPRFLDSLRLDYIVSQRVHHLPRFLATSQKVPNLLRQVEQRDGRSLVVAFVNEIDCESLNVTNNVAPALYVIRYPVRDRAVRHNYHGDEAPKMLRLNP